MKVQDFKNFVTKSNKVIKGNMVLPITENILFKDGRVYATNLETSVVMDIDIEGSFTVDFKDFKTIIQKVKKGDISFDLDEKNVLIKTEKGTFTLYDSYEVDEYPKVIFPEENIATFSKEKMSAIKKARKYVSDDELRPVMSGVFVEEDMVVGTNSHILKFIKTDSSVEESFILPPQGIDLIDETENEVYRKENYYRFYDNELSIIVRAIDGTYPNWKVVLPDKENYIATIKMSDKQLKEMIDMTDIVIGKGIEDNSKPPIKIMVSDGEMKYSCHNLDTGKSYENTIQVDHTGEDFVVGVRKDLVNLIVKTEKQKEYTIMYWDSARALYVGEDMILMPKMIKE